MLVLAAVGAVLGTQAFPARADTLEVTMANLAFSPESATVKMEPGEPAFPRPHAHVNFVQRDQGAVHTVSFDDRSVGVSSSGQLAAGQVFPVIIEREGTYIYRCEIHPTMTGTVIVTPVAPPPDEADDGSGTTIVLVMVVVTVLAAAVAAFLVVRRRRAAGAEPAAEPRR